MTNGNGTMWLVKSQVEGRPSFSLIPISESCPYNEIIYNPKEEYLVLISKSKKYGFRLLNPNKVRDLFTGEISTSKEREESRVVETETYYEYYVKSPREIIPLVNYFASNNSDFDFQQYISDHRTEVQDLNNL